MKLAIINGPNLNLLGKREPKLYGSTTLADIITAVTARARAQHVSVLSCQSNHEGKLIDFIQQLITETALIGLIINPGALTHTSLALHDALRMLKVPIVEVHLSNIYQRETFRHHSYVAPLAAGIIMGMGSFVYLAAADYLLARLTEQKT